MPDEITMITIDNMKIGIIGLTRIIDEVKAMKLSDENKLQDVLLEKMKTSNYVPDSREKEYAVALLNQYKKSLGIPVEEAEVIVMSSAFSDLGVMLVIN